ncbi:MAG: hypothetical protein R3C11_17105 [Planctomycetaceae bacterium]
MSGSVSQDDMMFLKAEPRSERYRLRAGTTDQSDPIPDNLNPGTLARSQPSRPFNNVYFRPKWYRQGFR